MDGFSGLGEATELLLSLQGEFGGLGGWQAARAPGGPGGGATLAAKFEFKLGQGGHDGGDGATCRGVRIYAFTYGAQQDSALTKLGDGAGYLRDGAPEPIDCGDDHGVTLAGVVQQVRQARPVGVHRTRELVAEDLAGFDALGSKRGLLCIEILTGGAYPCV